MDKLVIICGPTASGKTRLAIDVAVTLGGEIVNADSMQIYRGMDIGTAKPTTQEMSGVPHHLIGTVEIGQPYSAAVFQQQARACIADIAGRGRLPILCGGTGLFISSVLYDLDFRQQSANNELRERLQAAEREQGAAALYEMLAKQDPATAARIHPNNTRRVIRALEVALGAGQESAPAPLFNGIPRYNLAWIGLQRDRGDLCRRIDTRVEEMIRSGLLEEVRTLAAHYGRGASAFQALGYKELYPVLDGQQTLEEAAQIIKTRTRQYAKRQMTWFKRENAIHWLDADILSAEALRTAALAYIAETLHIS